MKPHLYLAHYWNVKLPKHIYAVHETQARIIERKVRGELKLKGIGRV